MCLKSCEGVVTSLCPGEGSEITAPVIICFLGGGVGVWRNWGNHIVFRKKGWGIVEENRV